MMQKVFRESGTALLLNLGYLVLLTALAFNRDLGDVMMGMVLPLLLISSAAIIYTVHFQGEVVVAVAASLLLETGQLLQILIVGEVPHMTKTILAAAILFGAVGTAGAYHLQQLDFREKDKRFWIVLGAIAGLIVLMGLMLRFAGNNVHGTRAWLNIGGLSLQLTEFFKPLFVLFHAVLWRSHLTHRWKLGLSAGMTVISMAMLVLINELGTLLVLALMWLILTFLFSEKRLDSLMAAGGVAVLGAVGLLICRTAYYRVKVLGADNYQGLLKLPYRIYFKLRERFLMCWDLDAYLTGKTHSDQPAQAREMIIKGGLLGSTNSKVLIPIQQSDYAYVSLLYRCGILFGVVVVVMFLLIFIRSLLLSARTADVFESVMFAGASLGLILPTFINVMGTTNFSFMTGIAIPFISHGGTNMLVSFFNVMLLLWGSCGRRVHVTDRLTASWRRMHPSVKPSGQSRSFTR